MLSNRDQAIQANLQSAVSWNVEYRGDAYADARKLDGVWYFRNAVARSYQTFLLQSHVIPVSENQAVSH
ncbi:MAG: hypothetical protein ABI823_17820 [Bryobacteraceae bacterium]